MWRGSLTRGVFGPPLFWVTGLPLWVRCPMRTLTGQPERCLVEDLQEEENKKATEPVNIGLPYQHPSRKTEVKERKKVMLENTNNPEIERDNRLRTYEHLPNAEQEYLHWLV